MKSNGIIILGIILVSLLPVYLLSKYLQRVIRPRESGRRFLLYMLAMLGIIFLFTFLVVFIIRLLFPGA